MYNLQYLVSGALSLFLAVHVTIKGPRTLALKFFFLFGVVTSLWGISNFFSRTASDAAMAAIFFAVVIFTSHIGFPLYLLTVLSIKEERSRKFMLLILIPAMIQTALFFQNYFGNFEFFLSESGWSYRVVSFQPPLIAVSIIFVGYLVGITVALFDLFRKASFPLLRKKYMILLVSFTLFQAVGTTLINALIALNLLDPSFRVGGILQFLTFLSIWYALWLKEEKIPLYFVEQKDFFRVYSSFLTVFYNSISGDHLGEGSFKFTNFIIQSGIRDMVSLGEEEIIFETKDDLDFGDLISRNLRFFSENAVGDRVVDHYLRVLNAAAKNLGWIFEIIVRENEDFLKKSDLIYGISGGIFLEEIVKDESLKDLEDIDACLKIYKRILLPLMGKIQSKMDLRNEISKHYIVAAMEITDYGEVSLEGVKKQIQKIPKDRRLSFIIENFNQIIGWIYEKIITNNIAEADDALEKLRLVLKLNKDRAVELGVHPTLLAALATRIPQARFQKLYSDYLEELIEDRTRELKDAQERLLKSQRLAAIGEAAAMIGHDLRNPLQAIVNTLYMIEKELELSPNKHLSKRLETIKEQVEYMNKIVSDLQDYARPLKPNLVEIDLTQLIKETLSTITIPETVNVSVMVEEGSSKIETDPTYLKRVLNNLVTNAIQAMPKGGHLNIRVSGNDEYVSISVQDTGIGIPKEHFDKIFQPLFTTKAKGQGLGLAVCKRLVEALEGSITVESKIGEGTTFTVKIPQLSKNASPESILKDQFQKSQKSQNLVKLA